jgi:RNA polymerase sigma-70 factor (ECF subfamily)
VDDESGEAPTNGPHHLAVIRSADERSWCSRAETLRRRAQGERLAVSIPEQRQTTVSRLRHAVETGLQDRLIDTLARDVEMIADEGGGSVATTTRGGTEVARMMRSILGARPALTEQNVNGQPGLVLREHGEVTGVICVDAANIRITRIWIVRNPAKLRHWN